MPIDAIKMPKWGLSMQEGRIVQWSVAEGATVREGDELLDIETSKITNVHEAHMGGMLRRIVARADETVAVGGLLGVMADADVTDAEIDAFIEAFQASFDPAEAAQEAGGPEIRTVDIGGRTLRVAVAGAAVDAAPLVLIHGFGGDVANWMLVQPPLSADRPVYAIELPGHGQSSKDVGDGTPAALADAVVAAIDALGIDRCALAGHSLGGAVAVLVAATLGDRATGLGLVSPAALPGGAVNAGYLDAFVAARRARDLREPARLLFDNADAVTGDMLEELIRAKRLDGAEAALAALAAGLKATDPAVIGAGLAALRVPVVMIASRGDRIVGAAGDAALPAGSALVWLEGASHMPHLENSSEVVALLRRI